MTILQKNIQLLREKLLAYAEEHLYSGFSETMDFKDVMTSAFTPDEIDNIYNELDEAGELNFLLKREFMFLEKGKINELYYLLESERINIISEMEENAPEYEG